MADMLPRFMVIRSVTSGGYVYYMNENNELRGFVRCQGESVFIPSAKIEVERATTGNNFVHLRFCYSNKYWARLGPGVNDRWIVASSSQPEEDISKSTCTLFEPRIGNEGRLFLTHIQTGRRVRVDWGSAATITSSRAFVDDRNQGDSFSRYALNFVDWETLVKMPNRVAFKGYNGKYLKSKVVQRLPYLEFSSDDGNEKAVAFEIRLNPDGHIRIKSDHFGRFWRRSPNWIWADADDNNNRSVDTLFWPVKIDHHAIALRNAGNNNFCKSLSVDRKTNCLNAAVSYITREARLVVEELVSDRTSTTLDIGWRMPEYLMRSHFWQALVLPIMIQM